MLIARQKDTTNFRLGTEDIVVVNDGGLGLRFNAGTGNVGWQPDGIRPVFSLKVCFAPSDLILRLSPEGPAKRMMPSWRTNK